jgi:hypothetical protein
VLNEKLDEADMRDDTRMRTTKRENESARKEFPPGEYFIDDKGVQCFATTWEDGRPLVLKILDVNDPFWAESRLDLEDIPRLNLDQAVSELRD